MGRHLLVVDVHLDDSSEAHDLQPAERRDLNMLFWAPPGSIIDLDLYFYLYYFGGSLL